MEEKWRGESLVGRSLEKAVASYQRRKTSVSLFNLLSRHCCNTEIIFRTMKLYKDQAQSVLEEYTGPRHEIEKKQLVSSVGKLPEYPHPVASSISSRIVVELGMPTAIMATAVAVVGGFLASVVL